MIYASHLYKSFFATFTHIQICNCERALYKIYMHLELLEHLLRSMGLIKNIPQLPT